MKNEKHERKKRKKKKEKKKKNNRIRSSCRHKQSTLESCGFLTRTVLTIDPRMPLTASEYTCSS
jgi:hypothetical protein